MMASSSQRNATSSSLQRFNSYLSSLREELELQSSNKSRRFNIYLEGLQSEFKLMTLEIESLQKEMDGYKEKAEARTKEFQSNFVCKRCSKTNASQIVDVSESKSREKTMTISSWFRIPFFQFKSLDRPTSDKVSTSTVTQKTISRIALVERPYSSTTPAQPSHVTSRSPGINLNKEICGELEVQLTHTICHERINCVNFSQDGKYLAAGCKDGKAYVYDVQTGTLTCVLRNLLAEDRHISPEDQRIGSILTVCFTRDGKYLATGSSYGEIYLWKLKTKHVRNAFQRKGFSIASLDFSPNDRWLVSVSNCTVQLWSMRHGAVKVFPDVDHEDLVEYSGNYTSAVFSPDGKYVAASNLNPVVRIWDARTGQSLRRVRAHRTWVHGIKFMPNGKGLVTASADTTLKYLDISSLDATRPPQTRNDSIVWLERQTQLEETFSGHGNQVASVAISPDGKWVASGSIDNTVRIWDTRNAAVQCILDCYCQVFTVDLSPAGGYLASGGNDGIRIWTYSQRRTGPRKHQESDEVELPERMVTKGI